MLSSNRKTFGFLGHNARLGCNKCLKPFETPTLGQTNYSGYNRSSWPCCSVEKHHCDVREVLKQNTKTTLLSKQSELGCRYSVLLQLKYFDPLR